MQAYLDLMREALENGAVKKDRTGTGVRSLFGRQQDEKTREYLHRGIAARQFQRSFLLAEGMQVKSADLKQGLLSIDLVRPQPERMVRKIRISARD